MDRIKAQEISGGAVYGVPQMTYTVDDVKGKDYVAAVTVAALAQASALEQGCKGLRALVQERMKKLNDLGEELAYLAKAIGGLPTKNPESDDKVYIESGAHHSNRIHFFTGHRLSVDGDSKATRANLQYAQNDVQYAIDREDNDLQQDLVAINSLFSKRDQAFSLASRLVSKIYNASSSITSNIGG